MHEIVIPATIFNAVVCGLITAACWNFVNCVDQVIRRVRKTETER